MATSPASVRLYSFHGSAGGLLNMFAGDDCIRQRRRSRMRASASAAARLYESVSPAMRRRPGGGGAPLVTAGRRNPMAIDPNPVDTTANRLQQGRPCAAPRAGYFWRL
jgi:hypothetical protein